VLRRAVEDLSLAAYCGNLRCLACLSHF
jgi:hypothetical protein